jgi:signal transduction histidine kinase
MIGHFFWACLLCVLIARRYYLMQTQLIASEHRLEALSRQLITAQESERRRLARELHDQIGQMLTAIKMNLRRTQKAAAPNVQAAFEENVQLVDVAIGQVRNLSLSLRPPQLDELGLVAALHWLVKHQAQLGGFAEQLDIDLDSIQIPPALETVCFRIAQEALTNTVRHGHASNVHVKLQASENQVLLMVHDNGVGFEVEKIRARALGGGSIGLISMQERANLVGGEIEIDSTSGNGTRIQAVLPLSGERRASA